MTGQLVQRVSNVGVLQTPLEFRELQPIDGSASFDGTAYLTVTSDLNSLAWGTGDFTIEWWMYVTSAPGAPRVFSIGTYNTATAAVSIESGNLLWWAPGGGLYSASLGSFINQWVHVAITRDFPVMNLWINGVQAYGPIFNAVDFSSNSTPLIIGNQGALDSPFHGQITNFQWVVGTALYTNTFTPPLPPVAPAAGCQLLLLTQTDGTVSTDSSGTGKSITNTNVTFSSNSPAPQPTPGVGNTYVNAWTFDEVTLAPNILSTDLWAWFDATNPRSYSGGVIWLDISGNGFYGIMNLVSPPSHANPGLYFNGFSSSINTNIGNPGSVPISMSFWVRPGNYIHMQGIYDSAPGQPHVLRHYNSSTPIDTAEWWNGDPAVSTGLTPGVWQYLTVNYHATTGFRSVDTYVNGQPVASGTGSPYIYYAWTNYNLGVINDNSNWYEGYMAEVQIYHRKPSVEEIAWNYSVGALKYGLTPSVDVYRNLPPGPTMPQPVITRMIDDGTLQVKTEFDEVTLS